MFDSKSPIVKYVGYVIIGFFLLIIIISFGLPDFVSRLGMDQNTVATVNGEQINRLSFIRYRDLRFRNFRDEKMLDYILNNMIQEVLLLQKAKAEGFSISDEGVLRNIKEMPAFRGQDGKYDPKQFELVLNHYHMSFSEFLKLKQDERILESFNRAVQMGLTVSEEDARAKYIADNSKLQIRYSFLSSRDFKKRNPVTVSDAEVEAELKKNIKEIKDPKSDRKRIKSKLTRKKLAALENQLISQINALANKKGSFGAAAGLMRGKLSMSAPFKPGEQVKDSGKKGKSLSLLANSALFRKNLLTLKPGQVSPAIKTATGIYVFTPVVQQIADGEIKKVEDIDKVRSSIMGNHYRTVSMNISKKLNMESEIIKNLKTGKKK